MAEKCTLCPVECGQDREKRRGYCGADNAISVAKYGLHPFEEPCISFRNGSGTVFFTGCSLRCVFCQNFELSRARVTREVSVRELASIFQALEEQGAENINLVTAAHYVPQLIQAFSLYRPKIPVVYNTHAYEKIDALRAIESEMEGGIEDLRNQKDALVADKYRLDSEIRERSKDMENSAAALESFRAQEIQLEQSLQMLRAEVEAITIEVAMPIPSEEEIRRTIRTQEAVMAKLGNVNLRAIQEYDERKARLDGLNAEVDSLNRHIRELSDLMASLTSKKKGLFMQSYDAVNENFKAIYAQLSGGGEAYMGLEDEEDPFSGGLMINAKPRNGKLLKLEALSGGEKSLTALSFIFAIQEHQPSPFYVLDEVDMFLDSINAEMVARRVKESSAKAQFIQVSLRKVTLALADHLIGVTRPPSGISRVIMQPDLTEVSRYEEEALRKQKEAQ